MLKRKIDLRAPILMLLLVSLVRAGQGDCRRDFERGVKTYDSTLFLQALASDQPEASQPLFRALCCRHLQIIKYAREDKRGIVFYGTRALAELDSAERRGDDAYRIAATRAYVCQLLAGTGFRNGMTYGPRAGKYLAAMKGIHPDGFDTRFIEAANLLEMPSFVGGDAEKALSLLQTLRRDYPDSVAVSITLAKALAKNKRKGEALEILGDVLKTNPADLWAAMLTKRLR